MKTYTEIKEEIQTLYLSNKIPWIIGYSGGKDSTTVLQMIFYALDELPKKKLTKAIHVICNDTLVENPAIVKNINKQLKLIRKAGKSNLFKHNPMLFYVKKVKPKLEDTFWVNLIAKGYPSPNRWFRWCTERLKIKPTSKYISKMLSKKDGKAIIVLGTRKAESRNRAVSMSNYDNGSNLRKHTIPNTFVYAPIADLNNNDVWAYLLQAPNPWGSNNRELLALYRNACSDGECPFVIETGTQSCGKSRFGCWVCTVVDRDKSMEHFIENGEEWMKSLLNFRNWLQEIRQQSHQYIPNRLISNGVKFGAFLIRTRWEILNRLLEMQQELPIKLIDKMEINRIQHLLKFDSRGIVKRGFKKYILRLPNDKHITVISDHNLLDTSRKRLGPIHLKQATLLRSHKISSKYLQSTRIMYYYM